MATNATNLCVYCAAFFPVETRDPIRPFYSTWEELEGQRDTCNLCSFIKSTLVRREHIRSYCANTDPSNKSSNLTVRVSDSRSCQNAIRWALLKISVYFPHTNYVIEESFSVTTREKSAAFYNSLGTASKFLQEDKILLCKEWLQDCESNHGSNCRPADGTPPIRLIDVGSEHLPTRLVPSSEISSSDRRYATLSHCWGRKLPIRTIRANLQLYRTEIPSQSIPRTFREAISITRALGIAYLWIDALCIIQDCPEEWEAEASKMKDIYSSSSINIAASDATGSTEGCFPDPDGKDRQETQFVILSGGEPDLAVTVQLGDIRRATDKTTLNTRGWILQEQLLSHRIVSCMRSELHWQCAGAYKTESGVEFESDSAIKGTPRLRSDSGISDERVWRTWMEDFSRRDFTFWKDRLPSLAGITEHYQKVTNDTPVLGLWRLSLIEDLLWVKLNDGSPRSTATNVRLPSWSWLSCTGHIQFGFWGIEHSTKKGETTVRHHSDLIDVGVAWSRAQLTSTLQSAHLVLEGPLIEVSMQFVTGGRISNPPYLLVGNVTIRNGPDPESPMPWVAAGQFDDKNHVSASSYTCLLIQSMERRKDELYRETFLILERVQSIPTASYRRMGIGCFFGNCIEFGSAKRERVHLI